MGNPIPLLRALFQSTLLMRGATPYVRMSYLSWPFQSTLLMRGATAIMVAAVFHLRISIHAPHARSDAIRRTHGATILFQSTLLMRGATAFQLA